MDLRHALATSGTGPFGIGIQDNTAPNYAKFAYCTVATAPCPTGDLQGYYANGFNAFTELRNTLPLHYVRIFVAYDALESYNASANACGWSPSQQSGVGQAAFDQLIWDIQGAQADGLTPVVAFISGSGQGGVPPFPEPGYGSSSTHPYYQLTVAGYDYSCGVYGLMAWTDSCCTSSIGSNPVQDWEAFNEPDGAEINDKYFYNGSLGSECVSSASPCGGIYNANGTGSFLCYNNIPTCGPDEAALLWEIAQTDATTYFAANGFSIAAGTLTRADNGTYLDPYAAFISGSATCGSGFYCAHSDPAVWAIHDYQDPSSGVAGAVRDVNYFTTDLTRDIGSGYSLWITESADDLNNMAQSDQNRSTAAYPFSVWAGCNSGENDHIASNGNAEFGLCMDGQSGNQVTGANSFLALANQAKVTQVDWYQFQATNTSSGFDSGVLAPPQTGYASPDGVYGSNNAVTGLRGSYCALTHGQYTACSSSATEASDWSANPGPDPDSDGDSFLNDSDGDEAGP